MFEVGVVVPRWAYWANPIKQQPLWELYYATLIQDRVAGANVRLIDTRGKSTQQAVADLPECDIYLYWIMKTADAPELYELARDLKRIHPESTHLAGGTHVDHLTDECTHYFDCVFTGTAETSIVAAIDDWANGTLRERYRDEKPARILELWLRKTRIPC